VCVADSREETRAYHATRFRTCARSERPLAVAGDVHDPGHADDLLDALVDLEAQARHVHLPVGVAGSQHACDGISFGLPAA